MAFCHNKKCGHCGLRRAHFAEIWLEIGLLGRFCRALGVLKFSAPAANAELNALVRERCPHRVD